jgi:hypothetical protein
MGSYMEILEGRVLGENLSFWLKNHQFWELCLVYANFIALTETRLNKNGNNVDIPGFDHITKCTRHRLSVYIKESFPYSLLQLDTSIQYLAIKLLDRIPCVIVYNPQRHQQNFIQNMKDTIIPFMSESCLVMGDFNIQNTKTRL